MEATITNSYPFLHDRRPAARRASVNPFTAWEERTTLVKAQASAESAASDAKTKRLRALRLEKESQDAEAARIAAENAPPPAPRKRPARG